MDSGGTARPPLTIALTEGAKLLESKSKECSFLGTTRLRRCWLRRTGENLHFLQPALNLGQAIWEAGVPDKGRRGHPGHCHLIR